MYSLPCKFLPVRWWWCLCLTRLYLSSDPFPSSRSPLLLNSLLTSMLLSVCLQKKQKTSDRYFRLAQWVNALPVKKLLAVFLSSVNDRLFLQSWMKEENYVLRWNMTMVYRGFIKKKKKKKTQREVNPPTYRCALLLSRGLRCMVNNIQRWRAKRSLLQPGAPPCLVPFCAAHLKQFEADKSLILQFVSFFLFIIEGLNSTIIVFFLRNVGLYIYFSVDFTWYVCVFTPPPMRLHWNGGCPFAVCPVAALTSSNSTADRMQRETFLFQSNIIWLSYKDASDSNVLCHV